MMASDPENVTARWILKILLGVLAVELACLVLYKASSHDSLFLPTSSSSKRKRLSSPSPILARIHSEMQRRRDCRQSTSPQLPPAFGFRRKLIGIFNSVLIVQISPSRSSGLKFLLVATCPEKNNPAPGTVGWGREKRDWTVNAIRRAKSEMVFDGYVLNFK
ncbi:hypothetical protein Nepgr_019293 [Nepenthes gracilis]|uniref:Uncharacterized protein n=1 Tax=Nepenthes gracilis TaxID=150966 RepID=A0AAD3SUN9_NEPGR|nr:hypothetical protein Nepgr_019293 [Nepenthes gracilis]